MTPAAAQAAERAARDSHARLLAILAARTRDIAAAEDALDEAFRIALDHWPRAGIPDRPEARLITVARRAARAAPPLAVLTETKAHRPAPIPDRRLALLFACTHPGLDTAVQTPLMPQAVLGLPADRIASAFLMTPAALGQRLSRGKARLKDMRAAFEAPEPDDLPARLPQVMEAVLAVASLGCKAVPGSDPARADLASEATQLAEVLAHLTPHQTEPLALLSLILHVMARAQARRAGLCP